MMNLEFTFKNNKIRTFEKDGEPWFSAKDVCEALGHTNTSVAVGRLEEDEVTKFNLGGLSGETNFVNEYGLYTLILGSRKPEAKEFKRWVTHEVIPSIRKNGMYATEDFIEKALDDPTMLIQTLQRLKKEQEEKKKLELELQHNKPKVLLAETVTASDSSISIAQLAKLITQGGYNIGQKQLFQWLRDNSYLGKTGEYYNIPNQRYVKMQLFEIDKKEYKQGEKILISTTTKVTGKGQQYFINKFLGDLK